MFCGVHKMLACRALCLCAVVVLNGLFCDGQFADYGYGYESYDSMTKAIPFPACRMDDIECLRRGLRTFFFLMDAGHLGMKQIDPAIINSVSVALPEQQMSFLLRNLNVTGARWTKLVDKRFNLAGSRSMAIFKSDLHVTGEIVIKSAERLEPMGAFLTMDIQGVHSNVSYSWRGRRGVDNYDYIDIGQERIAVRNTKIPTFFLQPESEVAKVIEQTLQTKSSILDHLSNEITISLMHSIVDNFRLFSRTVPVYQYYQLYKK